MPIQKNSTQNLIQKIVEPVFLLANLVTPAIVPKSLHIFLVAVWLMTGRVAFFLLMSAYGLLPNGAP
jgi:hypothetical protein